MHSIRMIGTAVVPLVLLAAPAQAGRRHACHLISDQRGDGQPTIAPSGAPNSPSLDLLSADLVSNTQRITAVIGLASLTADPLTAPGAEYKLTFVVKAVQHYLRVQTKPGIGPAYDFGDVEQTAPTVQTSNSRGPATGHLDTMTGTVVISVPRSAFPDLRRSVAYEITARSYHGAGAKYLPADGAGGGRSYQDGTKGCVPA